MSCRNAQLGVDSEITALHADKRARFVCFSELIEHLGLDALPRDSIKHLEDGLCR